MMRKTIKLLPETKEGKHLNRFELFTVRRVRSFAPFDRSCAKLIYVCTSKCGDDGYKTGLLVPPGLPYLSYDDVVTKPGSKYLVMTNLDLLLPCAK